MAEESLQERADRLATLDAVAAVELHHQINERAYDYDRLRALYGVDFADSDLYKQLVVVCRTVVTTLHCDQALVTTLTTDRNEIVASFSVSGRAVSGPPRRLEDSFCQFSLIDGGREFAVEDSRTHKLVCSFADVTSGVVVAYLGVPIVIDGQVIGTVCALDHTSRSWESSDVVLLTSLAGVAARAMSAVSE